MNTSTDNPIRVDHVAAYSGGWLGITFTPGKCDTHEDGRHSRNLDMDVEILRDTYAIDTFAWLIRDSEVTRLRVRRLPEAMAAAGIELVRFPITDVNVPADRKAFRTFLDDLHVRLARGERLAVACRGGCGRAGTVVGCLLRDQGLGPAAALAATKAARPCAPETDEQKQFVRTWDRPSREVPR